MKAKFFNNPTLYLTALDASANVFHKSEEILNKTLQDHAQLKTGVRLGVDTIATTIFNNFRNKENAYDKHISDLESYDPASNMIKNNTDIASDTSIKAIQIRDYLLKNAPKSSLSEITGKNIRPSDSSLNKYALQVSAAVAPYKIIEQMIEENTKLHPTQAKVLADLYPKLFTQIAKNPSNVSIRTGGIKLYQEMTATNSEEEDRAAKKSGKGMSAMPMSNIQKATMR